MEKYRAHERTKSRSDVRKGWLPELNKAENYELPIPFQGTPKPSARKRRRDRDRAVPIAAAGGPKPTVRERAVLLALRMDEVRTKDLTDIGVPRCYLARLCEEGLLKKVGYGRYRAAVPKSAAIMQVEDKGARRQSRLS